jgi:hypothetical protein
VSNPATATFSDVLHDGFLDEINEMARADDVKVKVCIVDRTGFVGT